MYSLQNPNALDSKVLLDFDHVKHNLKVDDEGMLQPAAPPSFVSCNSLVGLDITAFVVVIVIIIISYETFRFLFSEMQKMSSDPTYNINMSGDIKQMLQELGTEKGKETAMLGGGGGKAQKERAAALAAILAARSRVKEDSKSNPEAPQAFSIVDAASASVHGRSAAAAKASSNDKTAARIAMHIAGDRAPVNAKLVSFLEVSSFWPSNT